MNFTAEQLQENFDKLISYIDKYFEGDRKEQLKKLYMDHEERLLLMPASGNINYHNCKTYQHTYRCFQEKIF